MKVLLCHLVARIETASWKLKKSPRHSRGPETQETSMSSRARPWSVRDDCDPEHKVLASVPDLSKSCCCHTVFNN